MAKIVYVCAMRKDTQGKVTEQFTSLFDHGETPQENIDRVSAVALASGWWEGDFQVCVWESDSYGDEVTEDGKDRYRHHTAA